MEKKTKREIARKLREIRGTLTQNEFARLVGIGQGQISIYERGISLPGLEILVQIRRATGADLNQFADFETKED